MDKQAMKCNMRRASYSCSSLGTLIMILFVVGVFLLAYNITCLQPSIDKLQLEVDVMRRELAQTLDKPKSTYNKAGRSYGPDSTLDDYQMSQLSGQNNDVKWAALEKGAATEQLEGDMDENAGEEEDEEAQDNVDFNDHDAPDDKKARLLMGEPFNRGKRDVRLRSGHKRGRHREARNKRRPIKAMHLESYVTDDEWQCVYGGTEHQIEYGHGILTERGFIPWSHKYQFWRLADWCERGVKFASYVNRFGHVTINEEGLYYLYAQVMYHDLTGTYAYGIYVNEKVMFQCMVTRLVDSSEKTLGDRLEVYEQCYTGGLVKLKRGDRLSIQNIHQSAPKILMNLDHLSYWGVVKLEYDMDLWCQGFN